MPNATPAFPKVQNTIKFETKNNVTQVINWIRFSREANIAYKGTIPANSKAWPAEE